MLGAAPTCKPYRGVLCRLTVVAAGLVMLLTSAGNAPAEVQKARDRVAPVWGIALDGRQTDEPNLELLAQAKAAGVNAVVTDPNRWSPERHRRLAGLARGLGMLLIEPRRPGKTSPERVRSLCDVGARTHHPCAFVSKSAHEAVNLARRGAVDYVVVRLSSPADLDLLRANRSSRTQLIAVLTVGDSAKLDPTWDQAIASAVKDPDTTLATGLSGAFASTAIRDYFTLLDKHDAGAPTFDQTQSSAGRAGRQDRLPPTTPLGAAVTSATATSLVLKWTASTDNVGVAGYGIYLGNTSIGSSPTTTFTVTGLQCGSIYTFAIDAYDRRGNRSQKITLTGSTSSCPLPSPSPAPPTGSAPPSTPTAAPSAGDTSRPSKVAGLAASGITQTSITLTWKASVDNVGVTGYEILNGDKSVGTTPTTSYLLTGLACGTRYVLSVRAYDAAGNSSKPDTLRVNTAACSPAPSPDTQPPTTPPNVHLMATTVNSISLAWDSSSDNTGVAGYGVYRNGVLVGSTNSTSYAVIGLSCATSYTLTVDAYDAAGNHSQRAGISVSTSACPPAADTQAPTTPTNVHAAGATPTSIALAWTASTDNVGVTGYTVYNGSSAAGNATGTSYTVVGLSCGSSYTLAVEAHDAAGNNSSKASVTASTSACAPAPDTQAPTMPGGLHVSAATASSITLAWTASTDNVGVTGYGVYNGSGTVGNATSPSYTLSGLACATSYTLTVDAFDAAGNRSAKASISATTSACPAPGPTRVLSESIVNGSTLFGQVTWTAAPSPVSGTDGNPTVKFLVDGVEKWTEITSPYQFNGDPSGLLDTKTLANGPHTFKVTAAWSDGTSTSATASATVSNAAPSPPTDTQAPTVPGALHVTGATATSITVAWTTSTDNVGVAGYGLYRGGASTGTTTSTSATFSGLTCGTGYTLAVDAYDAAGNRSSQASISTPTSACPPTADTQAPTVPGALRASAATATSITVAWTASTDNIAVTGYGLYRNGTSTGTTGLITATFTGLACGTGYTLAVDAYDAAGNRSAKASITASTSACPPPADTQAPTVPGGLRVTAATANAISVSWTASTDNVGVTAYTVYNGSASAGTTSSTSYTLSGLSCGTGYTIAVDAADAAGNRSGKASVTGSTAACSSGSSSGSAISISPSGNDSTCVRGDGTKPCGSLNKALSLAQAGDKVQLAGGTYGSLLGCSGSEVRHEFSVTRSFASDTTVTIAPGATAIIPCQVDLIGAHLGIDASGGTIRIQGFRADGDNQFLRNVDIYCEDHAPYLTSQGFCAAPIHGAGNNFRMTGGSIGPTMAAGSDRMIEDSAVGYSQPNGQITGWVFDGVWFHDARWLNVCGGACHTENIYLNSVANFTIKNSKFTGCGNSAGIFITRQGWSYDSKNVQILGNVFDCFNMDVDAGGDISPGTQLATIAYNDGASFNLTGGIINFSSNIATNNPCPGSGRSGVTINFDHNLWYSNTSSGASADRCGLTDVLYNVAHNPMPDIFASWPNDVHLKAGTNPAVGIGNPGYSSMASPDRYGQTRSCGGTPDAGAAERCP